jgi:hypothetical protein
MIRKHDCKPPHRLTKFVSKTSQTKQNGAQRSSLKKCNYIAKTIPK